jgi:sugar lactone lactonase YvrE
MWYKLSTPFCFVIFLCFSCGKSKKTTSPEVISKAVEPSLELVWQTDSLLTTCEAVVYDKASKAIYVANINNGPWEKDDNGFISTINTNGDITQLKWIEGLSAPKGMGIYNGKLYVNDIDDLVEIDIENRKILNKYKVEDSPQLNDITVSPDGIVYCSGSNSGSVYSLVEGKVNMVASDSLERLNGLLWQKEALYYVDFGTQIFGAINLETKEFKPLANELGKADGIVRLENGDFITSSWQGEIYYIYSKDWTKTKLLDTQEQSINAADIDYIPETQTLLVPTFFHNRVMAYKVNLP